MPFFIKLFIKLREEKWRQQDTLGGKGGGDEGEERKEAVAARIMVVQLLPFIISSACHYEFASAKATDTYSDQIVTS